MRTIRELREARGWTQLELATRLGVTPSTVYNWERGRHEPRAGQLREMARLFGVGMDDVAPALPAGRRPGRPYDSRGRGGPTSLGRGRGRHGGSAGPRPLLMASLVSR
jgi:transcriptional regulator with XRE-family HTH domain